jgi:GH24 family phage-related lysozyme (muramidase)
MPTILKSTTAKTFAAVGGGCVLAMSASGIVDLNKEEAFILKAYYDPLKIPTICNGLTGRIDADDNMAGVHIHDTVHMGMELTKAECMVAFTQRMERTRAYLNTYCVKQQLSQNQSDALLKFTWNVGDKGACTSQVVQLINSGRAQCEAITKAFDNWSYVTRTKFVTSIVDGKKVTKAVKWKEPMLRPRRAREAALFCKPDQAMGQPSTASNLKALEF